MQAKEFATIDKLIKLYTNPSLYYSMYVTFTIYEIIIVVTRSLAHLFPAHLCLFDQSANSNTTTVIRRRSCVPLLFLHFLKYTNLNMSQLNRYDCAATCSSLFTCAQAYSKESMCCAYTYTY